MPDIEQLNAIWRNAMKSKEKDNKPLSIVSNPKKTVANIKKHYESTRKPKEDETRILVRGQQVRPKLIAGDSADSAVVELTNLNMIHAIADSAITNLLPANPAVSARPNNEAARVAKTQLDALLDHVFSVNRLRMTTSRVLMDCLSASFGVYEVRWDDEMKLPHIKDIPASRFFFDVECRSSADIGWFATVEPVSFPDLIGYLLSNATDPTTIKMTPEIAAAISEKAGPYPEWILDENELARKKELLDLQCWITVWRLYDVINNRMLVYLETGDIVAIDQPLPIINDKPYIPFVISTLAGNNTDAGGIADCQTVLPLQRRLTALHRLADEIASYQKPHLMANRSIIKPESLQDRPENKAGDFHLVGIGDDADKFPALSTAFFERPKPAFSDTLLAHINNVTSWINYTSTISDQLRGQAVNVRTATEALQIQTHNQNRFGNRQLHMFTAIEEVAYKSWALIKHHMTAGISFASVAEGTGNAEFHEIAYEILSTVDTNFAMVGYSAAKSNPNVLIELMHNNMPTFFQALPPKNAQNLIAYVLKEVGAPPEVYSISDEPPPAAEMPPEMAPPMPEGMQLPGM